MKAGLKISLRKHSRNTKFVNVFLYRGKAAKPDVIDGMSRWDDHFHQSPDYTPVHTAMDGVSPLCCQGTLLDPASLSTYFLIKTRTPEIKQLDVRYSNSLVLLFIVLL